MPTDALTGSRYPAATNAPNVPQDIQNAVFDLSDNTIPFFTTTTARDTAYSTWTTQGGVMRNGLTCVVGDVLYKYSTTSPNWRAQTGESYHDTGTGGGSVTASPSIPTDSATVTLPPGTWLVFYQMRFTLGITGTAPRTILLYLYSGSTQVDQTDFAIETVTPAGGAVSREHGSWTRLVLGASATLTLRTEATSTGGTQGMQDNAISAIRVG